MDDFRKYATKHLGMNSLVLDDVIKSQAGYLNPYILEERQLSRRRKRKRSRDKIPLLKKKAKKRFWKILPNRQN